MLTHRFYRLSLRLLAFCLLSTTSACSIFGAVLPDPTTRIFTVADIAGQYTYPIKVFSNGKSTNQTTTLTLNSNGTFARLDPLQDPVTGTWRIAGTNIELTYRNQTGQEMVFRGWYVTDAADGGFSIVGGADRDPDDWYPMAKTAVQP